MGTRRRHERGETFEEDQRLENDVRRAITPGASEPVNDPAVGRETQALRGERRARDVPTQVLQTVAIVRRDAHRGVQGEPFRVAASSSADVAE